MATKMININFSDDPFYRYKMPAIELRSQGRGNGIQFVIENMRDLAAALARSPEELTKYFQISQGSFGRYNPATGMATFTGKADISIANATLREYIFAFLLCPSCSNPETTTRPTDGGLSLECAACGKTSPIKTVGRFFNYLQKRLDQKTAAVARKLTVLKQPEHYYSKIRRVVMANLTDEERAAELTKALDDAVNEGAIMDEERTPFLVAGLFDSEKPSADYLAIIRPVLKALITEDQQPHLLYSLECVAKKYEDLVMKEGSMLLTGLLQYLYHSNIIAAGAVRIWSTDIAEPFVPEDFHQRVLKQCSVFLEWVNNDEEGEEDEDEYEGSYDSAED